MPNVSEVELKISTVKRETKDPNVKKLAEAVEALCKIVEKLKRDVT